MSLILEKLEGVRDRGAKIIARCPACAASGQDRRGEHLILYPDGRYGCVAFPGDSDHRRLIWRLAGNGTASDAPVRTVREMIWRGCRRPTSQYHGRFGRLTPIPPREVRKVMETVCEGVTNTRPSRPKLISTGLGFTVQKHALFPFVPLDLPFVDGGRYQLADGTEWPSRLDLYHADPAGPWIRRNGVLLAVEPIYEPDT